MYAHYKERGEPASDQGAVWKEVDRKMEKMGSSSRSDALHDLFEEYTPKLVEVLGSLSAPDGCNGAVFAIRGKIVGADLFDKPAAFGKFWPKLVQSYAMDALEEAEESARPLEPEKITQWLKAASFAKQECFDSPGLGEDVRIEGEHLVGAVLVVEQHPVHMELFREEK